MNEARPASVRLPSVDQVLRTEIGTLAAARYGHTPTVNATRRVLARARQAVRTAGSAAPDRQVLAAETLRLLEDEDAPSLRRVFNLTGTVLHTNLGRAILAEAAIEAAVAAMRDPIALEFDLHGGERGDRDDHVRGLIRELTGAEDATVVNNNAGAVLLVLNTLAGGRDAVVSRGELIEIGGSFRLPDIMARGGARLVEVGTTNRTHLADYERAVGPDTGLILKVHTSNYVIQGFTKSVPARELARLARTQSVPLVHDLGSGGLVDLRRYGLNAEPTVREALRDGADLVTFSGDKLLGGPQAGIIAGRRDLVALVAGNPMKRALRIDKIRLAALEAILKLYRDPNRLPQKLPTLRHLTRPVAEIAAVATRVVTAVEAIVGRMYAVAVVECHSEIGSGALPTATLLSTGIAVAPRQREDAGARLTVIASAFRALPIPVIGHVRGGALIFDCRCLDDEAAFVAQLACLPERIEQGGRDGN